MALSLRITTIPPAAFTHTRPAAWGLQGDGITFIFLHHLLAFHSRTYIAHNKTEG
ncbi:MAG: hypothetical protein HY064_08865 [Bacteroidetes bacterium]|nr:hypothetical protein [Bacteroidota bacterium]